jgi:hypothetical protein
MTRRENRQQRRAQSRTSVDTVLVCGGKVTEPKYFESIKKLYRNPAVKIRVKALGVSPVDLVRYAISLRRCLPDSAVALAARNEILLAVSNPCFEVWLPLHFERCMAALRGYDQVKKRIRRHVPDFDKECASFMVFHPGIPDALARARAMSELGQEHRTNPATVVWALVGKFDPPNRPKRHV